jgi:ligand-binding SRPBCC domain-containing protein
VAGPLGGDHADVDLRAGLDLVVVDREAVGEHEEVSGGDAVGDLLGPHLTLLLVREQDHHHVAAAGGVGDGEDLEAGLTRLGDRVRVLTEADDDVDSGLLQIECMGVALRAVAQDGDGLAVELREVCVLVVDHCADSSDRHDSGMPSFSQASLLNTSAEEAWDHATSFEGINYELMPIMRMTAPKGFRRLDPSSVVLGQRLFRSWVLLFGFIPFEYDDLTLVELEPGRRFLERSPMLSMSLWQHERIVEPDPQGGCVVTDNLTFEPRLPLMRPLARRIVGFQFRHRHRRLRRRFEGSAA